MKPYLVDRKNRGPRPRLHSRKSGFDSQRLHHFFMKKDKLNKDNRTEKTYQRRNTLRCDICPPNRGENAKRRAKYGKTKPKYKTEKRN
jgi:hypothetical protein